MTLYDALGSPRTPAPVGAAATTPDATAVCACGRLIVRGAFLDWTHVENPGRDHHYARPASRSAAHSDSAGSGELRSRDEDQPSTKRPIDAARFWSKVDRSGGPDVCWPWTAGTDPKGYGHFWAGGQQKAHRIALELATGTVGEQSMHSCDNPPCCNPAHLSWGDAAANVSDMVAKGRQPAHMRPREACPKGHRLEGAALYVDTTGGRHCRTCAIERKGQVRGALHEAGYSRRGVPLAIEAPGPCPGCGGPPPIGRHGQPRLYCAPKCRNAAWRRRAAGTHEAPDGLDASTLGPAAGIPPLAAGASPTTGPTLGL